MGIKTFCVIGMVFGKIRCNNYLIVMSTFSIPISRVSTGLRSLHFRNKRVTRGDCDRADDKRAKILIFFAEDKLERDFNIENMDVFYCAVYDESVDDLVNQEICELPKLELDFLVLIVG